MKNIRKPGAQRRRFTVSQLLMLSIALFVMVLPAIGLTGTGSVENTLGPKSCADCHKSSVRAWKESHHYKTFKALQKRDESKEIAQKMGLKRIKSGSDCLTCHYTVAPKGKKTKVVAGVSCESCHGSGKNWLDIHSDYGGKGVKKADETAEHKAARHAESEQVGMIRPGNIYNVAQNCYGCHTVPNEKLVNTGGHKAGSTIELVQWSQGEVRHNVWYSETNDASPIERLRMMYIIGKALDLEYSLRGIAKATEEQTYFTEMVNREKAALTAVKEIAQALGNAEYNSLAAVVNDAEIKVNNEAVLIQSADKISAIAKAISSKYTGSEFAAIDSKLPAADTYQGAVFQP